MSDRSKVLFFLIKSINNIKEKINIRKSENSIKLSLRNPGGDIIASGGIAEDAGFTLSTGGSTVLGFSFSGDYIGQGQGILTNISFSSPSDTACIELGDGAFSNQSSQAIPVIFGDCFEF